MTHYDDIIGLPHHQSGKHPRMPLSDRSAQFAPFSALTGYEDAVKATAREVEGRMEGDGGKPYERHRTSACSQGSMCQQL